MIVILIYHRHKPIERIDLLGPRYSVPPTRSVSHYYALLSLFFILVAGSNAFPVRYKHYQSCVLNRRQNDG
jgi:hypothetical protein